MKKSIIGFVAIMLLTVATVFAGGKNKACCPKSTTCCAKTATCICDPAKDCKGEGCDACKAAKSKACSKAACDHKHADGAVAKADTKSNCPNTPTCICK
jgi:hypothetical protein